MLTEEGWENCGRTGGLKGSKGLWIQLYHHLSNFLLSSPGQTYEGGIRVPAIARWPGVIPAGVVTDEAAETLDLFPTFLSLAGVPLPTDRVIDGLNITELLINPVATGGRPWTWNVT